VTTVAGGGGTIAAGRHLRFEEERPLCDLHLSLLQQVGVAAESFGDSTGPLAELGDVSA
jgi:hypothetical protein